jgi:hypothetical protein
LASSDDCKALLDNDGLVQAAGGKGPWKRLSKRKADDGVERVFQDKQGACFVRVLEDDQGQLSVNQVGTSLSDVTVAGAVASKPAGGGRGPVVPGRGQLCLNIATDPQDIKAADKFVRDLNAHKHPENADEIGTALANRMLFGVGGGCVDMSPPWIEDGSEGVFVSIVADDFWAKNQHLCDQPMPIEGLFPDPEFVESPNESSDFLIHGQPDVYAAVRVLLNAGFVWDAGLQAWLDSNEPSPPGVVAWLQQGAPLRPGEAGASQAAAIPTAAPLAPVIVQQANTPADLQNLVNALGKGDQLIMVVDDAAQPLPPDFWAAAEKMCQVMSNMGMGVGPKAKWSLIHVPAGSDFDIELRKKQPQFFGQPGSHVGHVSARGVAHSQHCSAEGMFTSAWEQMRVRFTQPKKRPGP